MITADYVYHENFKFNFEHFRFKHCQNIFDHLLFSKYTFATTYFSADFTKAHKIADDRSNPVIRNPDLCNHNAHPLEFGDIIKKLNARIR